MTNPTPYYTAVAPATEGPADANASSRVKAYTVLSGLIGLIPVLTVFKVVTTDQGVAIGNAVQALLGLAGAFGFAFVASKTKKQVDNGTFTPAPANPVADAFQAIDAIAAHAADTKAQAVSGVADALGAIQSAVSLLPGGTRPDLGGIANLLPGPVGDLVQDLADRGGKL